ncbi:hypothetical protein [Actinomadura sp. 9N215]|uniref:hypothetical protein n=1 Tax=Actinomadura sp. 9N215 TaxID=3375150 RepID=UPI003798DFE2
MDKSTEATTIVVTVDPTGTSSERITAEVRATLARLGVEVIPCAWSPDPDTIAECSNVDRVTVLDLND